MYPPASQHQSQLLLLKFHSRVALGTIPVNKLRNKYREGIRFARTVERIQKILISELTKIALVHLYAQGYDDSALTNFEL